MVWYTTGFNRYMVECELEFEIKGQKARHSFNRYMVECELCEMYVMQNFLQVLIDTWWNVNQIPTKIFSGKEAGFNRYMVECE